MNLSEKQKLISKSHYNLGKKYSDLGQFENAELAYKRAIEVNPNYFEAYNNIAIIQHKFGKLEQAEVSYKKVIELKPDYAIPYNNLGIVLKNLHRLKEAELVYKKAIEIKSDFPEAYNNLGVMLNSLGRLEEAESNYNQAIKLKYDYSEAHYNLGSTLVELRQLELAEQSYRKSISLNPNFADVFWNMSSVEKTIKGSEYWVDECLKVDSNHEAAKYAKVAMRFYQGDRSYFDNLMKSEHENNRYVRSLSWAFNLPDLPDLYFNRWYFFDAIIKKSIRSRPFYEFGVWRGDAFKYLIKYFKKGYGFDTFTGLPEDWYDSNGIVIQKSGSYSSDGVIPKIKGGKFIVGKFEDTLPVFFSKRRNKASLINFDADLFSSTLCALNYSKPIIDKDTILIFDEFIINENWEQDEFKALTEFCSINNLNYEVMAISFYTKQVAVKLIDI